MPYFFTKKRSRVDYEGHISVAEAAAEQLGKHFGSGGIGFGGLYVGGVESDGSLAIEGESGSKCLMYVLAHLLGGFVSYKRALGLGFGQREASQQTLLRCGEKHGDAQVVHSAHIVVIARSAAAASHHHRGHVSHLEQRIVLHLAKPFFAEALKEVAYGAIVLGLDEVVKIDEAAIEFLT